MCTIVSLTTKGETNGGTLTHSASSFTRALVMTSVDPFTLCMDCEENITARTDVIYILIRLLEGTFSAHIRC